MTAPKDPVPPPVPPHLVRRIIGPKENPIDVTGWTGDAILLHVADGLLRVEHKLDMLVRGVRLELSDHDSRIKALEPVGPEDAAARAAIGGQAPLPTPPRQPSGVEPVPPMRDPDASWHDYDEMFEEARLRLRRAVKDPKNSVDSDRARAIAEDVFQRASEGKELMIWRRLKSLPVKLGWEAAKYLVPALLAAAAAWWAAHASAPQPMSPPRVIVMPSATPAPSR